MESDSRGEGRVLERTAIVDCGWGAIEMALFPSKLEARFVCAISDNTRGSGEGAGGAHESRVVPVE